MIVQDISLAILGGMWTIVVWTWWIVVPVVLYFSWKNFKKAAYVDTVEHIVLSIKIPKNNEKGPVAAEMMFAALHGILHPKDEAKKNLTVQEHISLEIVSTLNTIEFFIWTPIQLKDFVEGQVYAQYPTAEISIIKDYSLNLDIDNDNVEDAVVGTELTLVKDEIYPIKTFQSFDVDPLAGITGMLSKIEHGNEQVWIQMLAMPVEDDWRDGSLSHIASKKGGAGAELRWFHKAVDMLFWPLNLVSMLITSLISPLSEEQKKKQKEKEKKEKEKKEKEGPKLSHAEETELTAIEEKSAKLGYRVLIRVVYLSKTQEKAKERIQAVIGAFKQFNTTNLNGFVGKGLYAGQDFLDAYRARHYTNEGYILNIEELASLYHLPHVSVETPNIVWTSSKKGEPPSNLPIIMPEDDKENDLTELGTTTFRNGNRKFGIKRDDRRRHMYIIGKSGVGKSRMLENLAIQDIMKGEGIAFIDPHGEAIERILKYIPKSRINDVVYLNPADKDFPVGFNPLESPEGMREETAKGFVSVLKRMFGFSWGPRLEYVLNHTVLALAEVEGSTMLGIVRMLTDKNYRKRIVGDVTDPVVQMFWLKEFSSYNDKMATETVAPILNKVGQFISSPIIRNIVGQPKSTIDFTEIMNTGKILLVDLSTGKIGEVNSELLGSLIITKLQLAAMQRAYIPEEERKDFYLYVDEFQNFATDSFATILSEARKYRLSLTVANQYIAQMEETVRDAVFGNVGTLASFRVGATDAAFIEKEFEPVFTQNDLINLDNRHIYINMLVDGVSTIPFSGMTLDSPEITEDLSSVVMAVSREKYGTSRDKVEDDIKHWYNVDSVIAGVNANEGDNPIITKKADETPKAGDRPKENGSQPNTLPSTKPQTNLDPKRDLKMAILENTKNLRPKQPEGDKGKVLQQLESTADYIVRHKDHDDKYVYLPGNAPKDLVPDHRGRQKGNNYVKNGQRIYQVKISMFEPKENSLFSQGKAPDVWVGTADEMVAQLTAIASGLGGASKFLGVEDHSKNPELLAQLMPKETRQPDANRRPMTNSPKQQDKQLLGDKLSPETAAAIKSALTSPENPLKAPETAKSAASVNQSQAKENHLSEPPMANKEIKDVLISVARPPKVTVSTNTAAKIKKEIDSEAFDNLKTINPNEKIIIKKQNTELKVGDEIIFR